MATPVPFRGVLHAQIGLPRIGPLFRSLFDTLIAITAMTAAMAAAARASRLLAAAGLAWAASALPHEEPRSRRNFAQ